jgi:hypothetical protein
MGRGDGGYSCGGEGVRCCDEDGLRRLLRTETCEARFGLKGVMGDDLILGESRLTGENDNNSSTFSSAREVVCEGSKGGAKVLREDRGVRGEEVANMESGSGESERLVFGVRW